jgi:H+-transporting ATPase
MEDAAPIAVAINALSGLTSEEAQRRLLLYGANEVAEEKSHPLAEFGRKFWAPVPWMLEVTVVLELLLHKYWEAIIIGSLLVFNAAIGFVQEQHAAQALAILRQRLSILARALRDQRWQLLPAKELVPGDVVHVRMGDLVPADLRLADGQILVDQSALTGESGPVEAGASAAAYAGTLVRRGEATGEVTGTGTRTYFGKTAELVRSSSTPSHLQEIFFAIVKYLIFLDLALIVAILVYGLSRGIPLFEILPFSLMLLIASVPVVLPATFTLASALGTRELATRGVLVNRLSAIEEAASMDVLASDKTGTITENLLSLAETHSYAPYSDDDLLRLAACASDDATQDPIDMAVLGAFAARGLGGASSRRVRFIPFDPATKRSEAMLNTETGALRVVKGAPGMIVEMCGGKPELSNDADALAAQGYRVLAVAAGPDRLEPVGLLALLDPPRQDSRAVIQRLKDLGVRVIMITGDGLATARTVAAQVGIHGEGCSPERLRSETDAAVAQCSVFGGVLPEDKYRLVQSLQHAGHVVGMTGDGVNDAPALKQAEVGIAVANATDVAKAAASLVLTNPGLTDVVAAIETSRRIYQRLLTYTLKKIINTIQYTGFLALGVLLTGTLVVTPLLILLLLFTNDFLTMSIATDHVCFSTNPNRWQVRTLVVTSLPLAILNILMSLAVLFAARDLLHLPLGQLQTVIFAMLVFSGQGAIYLARERHHLWHSRPSRWMFLSSAAGILIVMFLATRGIFMAPVSPLLLISLLGVMVVYLVAVDFLKVRIFQYFSLS